jgi:hypothetical protein
LIFIFIAMGTAAQDRREGDRRRVKHRGKGQPKGKEEYRLGKETTCT